MKKLSFLALAAAGLMLGACSSDKDDVASTESQQTVSGESEGFMAVNVNLPTELGTTRAANDVFDDGLADEYKVSDCAILLFQGPDEANATLMNAQDIILPFETSASGSTTSDVTTSYRTTAKVEGYNGYSATNKLYALVCLNYKKVMTISGGVPSFGGTALTKNSSKLTNIHDILLAVASCNLTKDGTKPYFFMTNAVLSTTRGGDASTSDPAPKPADIFQLAELDGNKIYKTKAEAQNNPAGDVFVERAVAKATLSVSATSVESTGGTISITNKEWKIDNTEPKSHVARYMGTAAQQAYLGYSSAAFTATKKYRFVGSTNTGTNTILNTAKNVYRTYWCLDEHYSDDAKTGDVWDVMEHTGAFGAVGVDNPQYCSENTFDVDHQIYGNTTRAIIKVTTDATSPFFTINGNETRYGKSDAESYIMEAVINNTAVVAAFTDKLKTGKSHTIVATDFKPVYERNASTGQYELKTLSMADNWMDSHGDDFTAAPEIPTTVITDVNNSVRVLEYLDGVMYYEARFQHFANTADETGAASLAPWGSWESAASVAVPSGNTPATAYPDNTDKSVNYLGRYGMVRNNWYDVDVTGISRLGSPVDPSANVENPGYSDDNYEQYISVKIHVLSWAKRTQTWSF